MLHRACADEKETTLSPRSARPQTHARGRTGVGRDMERANYKGRINLRVSLVTAKSYAAIWRNANHAVAYAIDSSPRFAGGSRRRTSALSVWIEPVTALVASRA